MRIKSKSCNNPILISIIIGSIFICCKPDTIEFSSEKWQYNPDNTEYPYRKEMVNSLVDNHLMVGMAKSEVLHILGKPDYKSENSFSYTIETEYKILSVDIKSGSALSIEFDQNQKLKNAIIQTFEDGAN